MAGLSPMWRLEHRAPMKKRKQKMLHPWLFGENEVAVKQSVSSILTLVDGAMKEKKGERVRSQVSYPARARCFAAALLAELLSEPPRGVACKLFLQVGEGFILEPLVTLSSASP